MTGLPEGLEFKLLHVGVAVPEIGPAQASLESLFGYRVISGPFDDRIQRVIVNFMTQSDQDKVELELIAPLTCVSRPTTSRKLWPTSGRKDAS